MAEHNDRLTSIPAVAEEDSSETTLSLPVLNLQLNSSETTETTLSGNVTPLVATDGGPSEGTFAPTSGREIRFLPRPNSSTNVNKSNRSETSRRNEFLFLLTTDSSNTTRSEDDDIRVEEEEDVEGNDEKDDTHANASSCSSSRNIGLESKKPPLQQSLSSLYKEIQFELRPQEAVEEVDVLSHTANETKQEIDDEDHESTIEDDDEGDETIRYGEEADTDHTNTEATDETFSNSNLLSDGALLLPRIRNHEDSLASCCEEDDDVDDFECTTMFELSRTPKVQRAMLPPQGRPMEISPSARTASKSTSTRTHSSDNSHSASRSRSESDRSRAHLAPGPAPGSPSTSQWPDRSASKSSSVLSVSAHPVDTPPVPPRRSPNTDESQKLPPHSPLRTSPRVASAPFVGKDMMTSISSINRRPSSPVFKDLMFEATKIITPSHSPLLSAAAPSSSRVRRLDGEDAPEIPAAAKASTSLTARLEEPKNLYEELLQFHREQEDEDSTEQGAAYSGSNWKKSSPSATRRRNQLQLNVRSQSVGSLQSIEDSKLPAQGLQANRQTGSKPYHYASSPLYQELLGARKGSPDTSESHGVSGGRQPLQGRTSLSHLEADEAIARILQEELDAEQRRTDEESLRAALALQRQEEQELAARQQQTVTNDNLLPLVLPEGTSMEEQQRILEQIRQQQEEAHLRQALNISSHSPPEVRGSMTSGLDPHLGSPSNRSTQVSHQPRYPPPQPHAYPHRRSSSHETGIPDDASTYGASARGGSVNSDDSNYRVASLGSFGSVQPAATFPRTSISDAFERQFRPREHTWAQPSSQRHRSMSSTDSLPSRPIGNGGDGLSPNIVDPGTRMHRPDWELSQQEALREFQAQRNHQELSHVAPTTPSLPSAQLDLVQRGAAETARAVQVGRAHIVQCQNCQARLQAPIQYALVYCPSCGMVSPGRSYVPTTSASASSTGSGYASVEQGPSSPGGNSLREGDSSSGRKSWY